MSGQNIHAPGAQPYAEEVALFEERAEEIGVEVSRMLGDVNIQTVETEAASYKVVDLRGKFCSRLGNWGTSAKNLGVIGHYNGPAVPARAYDDMIAWIKFINDLHAAPGRFQAGWTFDGIAYHEFIHGDTVYRLRDYAAKLPHCGNLTYNTGALGLHIPVGTGQRPTDLTYRTFFQRVTDHNEVMKRTRQNGLKGHREVGDSACPGDIIQAAINSYRSGGNPGGIVSNPPPNPPASTYYVRLKTSLPAGKAIHELPLEAAKKEQERLRAKHGVETELEAKQ